MGQVLITGANRGIGLEFARQYAADGWRVIAACRKPQAALQALAADYGTVEVAALDVSDAASIAALAARMQDAALDILINNAGIYSGGAASYNPGRADASQSFGTMDAAGWEDVLRVNSIAPVMVAQALLPMVKRGKEKKIISISSLMGSIGTMSEAGALAYRSSKAALNAAMRNVAMGLEQEGIIVAVMHPGWVQTAMGGMNAALTPEQSVTALRRTIAGLTIGRSGQFINYDGEIIPW